MEFPLVTASSRPLPSMVHTCPESDWVMITNFRWQWMNLSSGSESWAHGKLLYCLTPICHETECQCTEWFGKINLKACCAGQDGSLNSVKNSAPTFLVIWFGQSSETTPAQFIFNFIQFWYGRRVQKMSCGGATQFLWSAPFLANKMFSFGPETGTELSNCHSAPMVKSDWMLCSPRKAKMPKLYFNLCKIWRGKTVFLFCTCMWSCCVHGTSKQSLHWVWMRWPQVWVQSFSLNCGTCHAGTFCVFQAKPQKLQLLNTVRLAALTWFLTGSNRPRCDMCVGFNTDKKAFVIDFGEYLLWIWFHMPLKQENLHKQGKHLEFYRHHYSTHAADAWSAGSTGPKNDSISALVTLRWCWTQNNCLSPTWLISKFK